MGPWGPKMGVPPKKPLFLRKMPFQYFGVVTVFIGVPTAIKVFSWSTPIDGYGGA